MQSKRCCCESNKLRSPDSHVASYPSNVETIHKMQHGSLLLKPSAPTHPSEDICTVPAEADASAAGDCNPGA
jgi:hypothetical protein